MRVKDEMEHFGLFTKEDAPVPLTGVRVNGRITGRAARVTLTQRFENREDKAIEAVYKFPLPEGSAVCGFTVATGDRVLRGRVEERNKAFAEYDEALAQGHGAFLLDEERPNIFTLSVGNAKPRHAVDIEVSYITLLETNDAEVRFVLPTTISPRYTPTDMPDQNGIPVNKLINPELRLDVPYGLRLHLDVLGRKDVASIECPSHAVRTSYADDAIVVEFSSDTVAMDRDFVLTITRAKGFESRGYSCKDHSHGYVQLDFSPRFDEVSGASSSVAGRPNREIIFLLDCSGSMGGDSIEQAKKALEVFLRGVPAGTMFNLYRFGSTFSKLYPHSIDYNETTLATALQHLAEVDADLGGTELLAPIRDIYSTAMPNGMTRSIILLTDGQVGNEADILKLVQSDSRAMLFTVGIGFGPNEYLVKKLATLTGGATESVAPGERIEPKVLRLYTKVMKGAVEDLVVDWGTVAEQAPLRPVVHDGECVSLLAQLAGGVAPEVVKLRGKVNGVEQVWEVQVVEVDGEDVAPPLLWARAHISDLEEGVVAVSGSRQLERRERTVEGEIIAISKQYGLLSRATSFITVEYRVDAEKSTGEIELRKVPGMLTRGWGGVRESLADMQFMAAPHVNISRQSMRQPRPDAPLYEMRSLNCRSMEDTGFGRRNRSMPRPAPADLLPEILAMQTAGGGFLLRGEEDAKRIGLSWSELINFAKRTVNGGPNPLGLVCTAVILQLLEQDFGTRRDEWFAVTEKTRKWFQKVVAQLNPNMDGIPFEKWASAYTQSVLLIRDRESA